MQYPWNVSHVWHLVFVNLTIGAGNKLMKTDCYSTVCNSTMLLYGQPEVLIGWSHWSTALRMTAKADVCSSAMRILIEASFTTCSFRSWISVCLVWTTCIGLLFLFQSDCKFWIQCRGIWKAGKRQISLWCDIGRIHIEIHAVKVVHHVHSMHFNHKNQSKKCYIAI